MSRTGTPALTMRTAMRWPLLLALAAGCTHEPPAVPGRPVRDRGRFSRVDELVEQALADGEMAGGVVAIGRQDGLRFLEAYGHRVLEPVVEPMTTDTVFDLASLTKPVATATSVLLLAERGLLDLDAPVATWLPSFGASGKDQVTVADLLLHVGGLLPDNHLDDYLDGVEEAWRRIDALPLQQAPGERFVYTDVGYLVLGRLVEAVSGQPLDEFVSRNLLGPLGMTDSGFRPGPARRRRAAATEERDGTMLRGEVHDPRAALLGGVAGHAGLFSTAEDLSRYARMLLALGEWEGARILAPDTVRTMTRGRPVPGGIRSFGWDVQSRFSSNRGVNFSDRAFGHGGFTGTALWVDPELDVYVIFLGNRLHPDGEGTVNPLIGQIGAAAVAELCPWRATGVGNGTAAAGAEVSAGVDLLEEWHASGRFPWSRVGLITNHTGRARDGRTTQEVIDGLDGVQVTALFSPEHGFLGVAEGNVDSAILGAVPIHSLYGDTRKPTPPMLEGTEVLVFDVQDAGARFYTYISTMGLAMEAAAEKGLPFLVLDRPNPINGRDLAGPLRDADAASFVAWHDLPVRHGMTVGELARMFVAERGMGLELHVVPLRGWRRELFFEQTGLRWRPPSPNLRTVTQALLYPGVALLEFTNVSVGRGTDHPFEWVGAPWLEGERLCRLLSAEALPGLSCRPVEFTPAASRHAGERCAGVELRVTDRNALEPVRAGLVLACLLRDQFGEHWEQDSFAKLLGNQEVFQAFRAGAPADALVERAEASLQGFAERRRPFLLYDP